MWGGIVWGGTEAEFLLRVVNKDKTQTKQMVNLFSIDDPRGLTYRSDEATSSSLGYSQELSPCLSSSHDG